MQELDNKLSKAIAAMRKTDHPLTAVASGTELFRRFITLTRLDIPVSVCIHKTNNVCTFTAHLQKIHFKRITLTLFFSRRVLMNAKKVC